MNRILLSFATLLVGATLVATDAEAARFGGGRSSGMQRNYTAPPASAPARQAVQPAQAQPPAAAPASGLSRWMPMLGGLALGGLIGSMFGGGLGGGLGGVLVIALIAFGAFLLVRILKRPRVPIARPMQFADIGSETTRIPVQDVGAGTPSSVPAAGNFPAGFDVEGFLRAARMNFVRLQVANDSGDVQAIREVVTPGMFDELSKDIRARGAQPQTTDIVSVDADLLEVAPAGTTYYASVRFSGMVREEPGTPPKSFNEVWNLAKPADGSTGWLLAGIQQESPSSQT